MAGTGSDPAGPRPQPVAVINDDGHPVPVRIVDSTKPPKRVQFTSTPAYDPHQQPPLMMDIDGLLTALKGHGDDGFQICGVVDLPNGTRHVLLQRYLD